MAAEWKSPSPGQASPAVLDALGPQGRDALIESYEQGASADIAAGVDFTARLNAAPGAARAAYLRRLDLLNALPLGDLTGKVCVDFGVGNRGFGASFPRLQKCGKAIGIDFALTAVNASAEVSAGGQAPYGRNFVYLTSRGDHIDLPDASADVIYAGESIERIENVDGFLEEAHRILKPGGLLVLTTIQPDPETSCGPVAFPVWRAPEAPPGLMKRLSRITPRKVISRVGQMVRGNPSLRRIARFVKRGLVGAPPAPVAAPLAVAAAGHTASPEHLGGLVYADLCKFLASRFEVLQAHGYGDLLENSPAPQPEASQVAQRPEHSRGIILLARKRSDYKPAGGYRQRRYPHHCHNLRIHGGPWEITGLHRTLNGRLATGGEASWLTLPVREPLQSFGLLQARPH